MIRVKTYINVKTLFKYKYLYIMIMPGMLYYLIFHYLPMLGLVVAFKDYNMFLGIAKSSWAGLRFFNQAFSSPVFLEVLRNTIVISLLKLFWGFPAPIILALLINEVKNTGFKRVFQTVSYLPYFISWVVLAVIINDLLSPNNGVVNLIIESLGMKPIYFMSSPEWFIAVLVISDIVKSIGWTSIIYLSALTTVDPQLYDAAVVDGCNRWKQTWHITLASIRPTIIIVFIISLGNILNAGFEQVYVMQNSAVTQVSNIIDIWVYNTGLKGMQYSFATAVGLFKSVVSFILVLSANILAHRVDEDGIW